MPSLHPAFGTSVTRSPTHPIDEPILLTELDGFLTGVLACPKLIMPSEWLPIIWDDDGAPLDDPADVQLFADMVMARYNEIVRDFDRDQLQPIFDVNEHNGDVLWKRRVEGFEQVMALRPDTWATITAGIDEEGAAAMAAMSIFVEVASGERERMSWEINELSG